MIKAIKTDEGYAISFCGNKYQFVDFLSRMTSLSLEHRKYDKEKKRWVVDEVGYSMLKSLFDKIDLKSVVNKKTKVVNYKGLGSLMKLEPYPYQKEAMKFGIDTLNALLVLPCGSGKTPSGIGIYMEAKEAKLISRQGMIIVKASLKTQWVKEVEKFSDLKSRAIKTPKELTAPIIAKIKRRESRLKTLLKDVEKNASKISAVEKEIDSLDKEKRIAWKDQFEGVDLFVLNYETLRDPKVRAELHRVKLDFIFADEIQYVKSKESSRSKALCEFGEVKMRFGATATPVGKNPEDLFGIFKFIKPDLFPKFSNFAAKYIKYAGFGKIAGFKNLDDLRDKIAPYLFVKTKEEVASQLPSLVVIQRYCDLEPEQIKRTEMIFAELEDLKQKEYMIRINLKTEFEARRNKELPKIEAMIMAHQTFAQEIAISEQLLVRSESEMAKNHITGCNDNKIDLLMDLIEEILDSEEKVCVFSRFTKIQDVITERIAKDKIKTKIAYVHGALSSDERYKEVYTKFRDDDDYKVLLMSDAGAEGINLSKCKYVIELEPAISFALQTQRWGRVERADSIHDNVFVYQLIANNSYDEVALKIVAKKESYDTDLIRAKTI